uniref:RxLR effector protein n=1 Tax=Phytophthora sojae TaxID=67593 RepID=G1FR90_PHYSO|nr:Avh84 [Phytophthora sojae]
MRTSFVLLAVTATVVTSDNVLSIKSGAEQRFLRSHRAHRTHHANDAEEERGRGLNSLPDQFKRRKSQPEFRKTIFTSRKSGMGTVDEAVKFMKSQYLDDDHIEHFKEAYKAFLRNN